MNLADVRTRVLEQVDWQPTQSAAFVALVHRLINRAYQTLCREAPYAFWDDTYRIYTQADVTSTSGVATDRLSVVATDRLVLSRPIAPTGAAAWVVDGTWDGRFLELETTDGDIFRRQIREAWTSVGGAADYVSIDKTWRNATDTGMEYRIFTPAYYLPGDVIELRAANVWDDTNRALTVVSTYEMEEQALTDYRGRFVGPPSSIFRKTPFALDAPTYIPTVGASAVTNWTAGDPAGSFDYCFTYCWGRNDLEDVDRYLNLVPRWESPPSPMSATRVTTNGAAATVVTLPDVDYMQNFGPVGLTSDGRSGYFIRLYGRRHTQEAGTTPIIESPVVFFRLADVAADAGSFTHSGAASLDYNMRLKDNHGYQSVGFYPMPDNRYEIDCRVLRAPQALVNAYDTPRIHADAIEALILGSLRLLHLHREDEAGAMVAKAEYEATLQNIKRRYGVMKTINVTRRPARVRSAATTRRAKVGTLTSLD